MVHVSVREDNPEASVTGLSPVQTHRLYTIKQLIAPLCNCLPMLNIGTVQKVYVQSVSKNQPRLYIAKTEKKGYKKIIKTEY